MVNSRLGLSSAAGSSSRSESLHQLRPSLSRSYGCILPSSLTRVFPRTLGYSPRLPVSVLVRATSFSLEAFLGSVIHGNLTPRRKIYLSALSRYGRDLPPPQPAAFDWLIQQPAHTFSCVTPLLKQNLRVQEYSPVVHRLCLLPRLRSRLTLSRRALLRNP